MTLMNETNFSPYEEEAILRFLRDYVNKDNLSIYTHAFSEHLFTAYIKLTKSVEAYCNAMGYSE